MRIAAGLLMLAATALAGCGAESTKSAERADMPGKVVKPNEQWRAELTDEQYRVLREKGTERAFSGEYWSCTKPGLYRCAGCGLALFDSSAKFQSGTGWPSFSDAVKDGNVVLRTDDSHGMVRTEVLCGRCGGHLGHVFDDGPAPTGKRYCINSAAIKLEEKQ